MFSSSSDSKRYNSKSQLVVLYGSQTGQAKSISEDVKHKGETLGFEVLLLSMEEAVKTIPWINFNLLIVITSSTGDGDPPENALLLWRKLRSKDGSKYLDHINYALLGLGDSNYTTFGGFPKAFDKQFQKLGAKKIYETALADDAVGLEIVVDPWIENLWNALKNNKPCLNIVSIREVTIKCSTEPEATSEQISLDVVSKTTIEMAETVEEPECLEECVEKLGSLTITIDPLSNCNLKIPLLPAPYLEASFNPELREDNRKESKMPSAASPVCQAMVKSIKILTSPDALKTTLEADLDISEAEFEYQTGDSIGIYCSNPSDEVQQLLKRLNILDKADICCELKVRDEVEGIKVGTKLKYEIPSHLPLRASLRSILTDYCEIRSVPKKALLRILAEHTSDPAEKRRLLELCSIQGSDDYTKWIREPSLNVLDLLNSFPLCNPPIERLLEQWPRLLARPYSLSCSPLKNPKTATFLFNVVKLSHDDGRTYERKGVATGMLENMLQKLNESDDSNISNPFKLSVYLRQNNGFKMPSSTETPLILIGPGTGVAPFLGFLSHREELLKINPNHQYGPIWLFYGCRAKDKDYLHRSELEKWHSAGIVTRLLVSFSRENVPPHPRYVQDLIKQYQNQLIKLIIKGAMIFVCGDAKNMAKDVMKAFTNAFRDVQHLTEEEALKAVLELQKEKRYLQDIWT